MAAASTRVLWGGFLFTCLIRRNQLPLTLTEKKLTAWKSGRSQNQWKLRETGSIKKQSRQCMKKILSHILWSHSLGTQWILIPIHPHTATLSTAASSKQFNIIILLRVSVQGKIVWFVHSLPTRSRQVEPTSPYLIFPPNKKDMQLLALLYCYYKMESINNWQRSKHQNKIIQYKDFKKNKIAFFI